MEQGISSAGRRSGVAATRVEPLPSRSWRGAAGETGQRIKWVALARPLWKKLDQGALSDEVLHADRLDPGNPDTRQAGAEHRSKLGHHEASCNFPLNPLVFPTETPCLDELTRQ